MTSAVATESSSLPRNMATAEDGTSIAVVGDKPPKETLVVSNQIVSGQLNEQQHSQSSYSPVVSAGGKPEETATSTSPPAETNPGSLSSYTSTTAVDEDVVDSALLAALRDPRERLALLKLEQVLVDFLEKQPQDSYIDVGGPYNSMVLSPTLGYVGSSAGQQDPYGYGGGNNVRPQTTFQRCILHRLCDRFRMTREKSSVGDSFGYYIRVCKGQDSRMPPRLLLNVQPAEYAISNNTSSTGNGPYSHTLTSSFEQMGLSGVPESGNMSGVAGTNGPSTSGNSNNNNKSGSKNRKMKIMKRSSSSNISANSSDNNNSGNKSSKSNNKNRNSLSEKEKKYAEARARIFQQEESSSGDGISSASNERAAPPAASALALGKTSSNGSSSSSIEVPPTSSSSPQDALSSSTVANNSTGTGEQAQSRSKATYRNRQQEEADPDFRRGVGMVVVPPGATYPATHGYYANNNTMKPGWNQGGTTAAAGRGYFPHQPQQHYSQNYSMAAGAVTHPNNHAVGNNVVVVPGTPSTLTFRQGHRHHSYSPSRGTNASAAASQRYNTTVPPPTKAPQATTVDITRQEHFPALR